MVVKIQQELPPANFGPRHTEVKLDFTTTGDTTLVAAVASKRIKVHRFFFTVDAATTIKFKDGASTDFTGYMSFTASGANFSDASGDPWFTTTAGNAFVINQSGTAQISGRLYYTVVS